MRYEMTEDEAAIGRGRECAVVLAADSGVSRVHCRITRSGKVFLLTDAGSANGTRLNGKDVGKNATELCDGDKIGVGATEIVFDDPMSPKRSWVGKVMELFTGGQKTAEAAGARRTSDGTVFGEGYIKCGKCGAKINTGRKTAGQKVGCGRCRSVYVIPPK